MAEATKIEWCDATFNPWRGCQKVSPGCQHCYAETLAKRNPAVLGEWGPNGTRVVASESYWKQPLKWDREAQAAGERRRVFCASLADVFEDRPELEAPRLRLLGVIAKTHSLNWLLLTKRPENVNRLVARAAEGPRGPNDVHVCGAILAEQWAGGRRPANVWLGVSVENQEQADLRIPHLLRTPAAVRFLSCEPLLGPVEITPYLTPRHMAELDDDFPDDEGDEDDNRRVAWVIVGGESGAQARRCDLEWVRSLVTQCKGANVPCFVKQLGADPVSADDADAANSWEGTRYALGTLLLRDRKGGNPEEWPADLRVRQFPNPH